MKTLTLKNQLLGGSPTDYYDFADGTKLAKLYSAAKE